MYTAIMATHPREMFALDAIASIYEQSLAPDRVVVVLNGPDASSSPLAREVPAAFPDVELEVLARPGMAHALAHAIESVVTPYVAFLDADDLWAPRKQERQIGALDADRSLDAVGCETVNFRIDAEGRIEEGFAGRTRMFGATTFRTDAFARFGLPDRDASHFAWLFRWWAGAQADGISSTTIDYRGLRRRIHESNGWVVKAEEGRAVLMTELRRIARDQRDRAPKGAM